MISVLTESFPQSSSTQMSHSLVLRNTLSPFIFKVLNERSSHSFCSFTMVCDHPIKIQPFSSIPFTDLNLEMAFRQPPHQPPFQQQAQPAGSHARMSQHGMYDQRPAFYPPPPTPHCNGSQRFVQQPMYYHPSMYPQTKGLYAPGLGMVFQGRSSELSYPVRPPAATEDATVRRLAGRDDSAGV
jgi:hypothetical protein